MKVKEKMQRLNKPVVIALLISALSFGVTGCSSMGKTLNLDTKVLLNFQVWDDVNPDSAGRPSPVVVTLFELEDARQFSQEDFIHLYEDPKKYLGKDLIKLRRLKEFTPGYDRSLELIANPATRFIGMLVEFSQYDKAEGRVVFEVKPHAKTKLNLLLSNLAIEQVDRKARSRQGKVTEVDNRDQNKRVRNDTDGKLKEHKKSGHNRSGPNDGVEDEF